MIYNIVYAFLHARIFRYRPIVTHRVCIFMRSPPSRGPPLNLSLKIVESRQLLHEHTHSRLFTQFSNGGVVNNIFIGPILFPAKRGIEIKASASPPPIDRYNHSTRHNEFFLRAVVRLGLFPTTSRYVSALFQSPSVPVIVLIIIIISSKKEKDGEEEEGRLAW